MVFNSLFKGNQSTEIHRLRETLRLGCLLHDIGHAPLSHSTESVMPMVSELKLPKAFTEKIDRQATHEDYTIKSIVDSSFTSSFRSVRAAYGVEPESVAQLVTGICLDKSAFTVGGINYFPLMHQLVSSEMDCDRMDYLLRDSYFCGVSYGKFDLDWIIDNLKICVEGNDAYLGISERAISTFDDFLLSRFHMFMMVYFHYRAVCLEQMLLRYFQSAKNEYAIPADIESYLDHDDPYLYKVLKNSKNEWAQRVVRNDIPKKILETFGGVHMDKMATLEKFFQSENIDYIKCSSKGRLSKYYSASSPQQIYPMKVMRESALSKDYKTIKNIQEATDLFQKYSESHAVNRIHCDFEDLSPLHQKKVMEIIQS